jgi:hypothetical protein
VEQGPSRDGDGERGQGGERDFPPMFGCGAHRANVWSRGFSWRDAPAGARGSGLEPSGGGAYARATGSGGTILIWSSASVWLHGAVCSWISDTRRYRKNRGAFPADEAIAHFQLFNWKRPDTFRPSITSRANNRQADGACSSLFLLWKPQARRQARSTAGRRKRTAAGSAAGGEAWVLRGITPDQPPPLPKLQHLSA